MDYIKQWWAWRKARPPYNVQTLTEFQTWQRKHSIWLLNRPERRKNA